MELLSVAFYGGRAPYMSNNDVTAEVGDKAHAGSQNPHHVPCFLTKMHGNYKMIQDFGNAQVVDSSLEYRSDDLPGKMTTNEVSNPASAITIFNEKIL